jgi:glutaminyl-peptide cyclotransferase
MGLAALLALGDARGQVRTAAPRASYTIIHRYPHDPDAFTQGLEFREGLLYEGTGLNGRSSIRQVALETGEVLRRRPLSPAFFGEGITIWGDELIQLTWRSQLAFTYDRETFAPRRTFTYVGEGWGLTHDETSLIMSDGTADLRFLDPATFKERRRVTVTDGGTRVASLNEIEYVKGEVYANIWQTDLVARIAPDTGRVLGWIDFTGLLGDARVSPDALLNGIAYDAAGKRLFVTGKLWPTVFEVKLRN